MFRIREDVKLSTAADFSGALGTDGKILTIRATLHYQACNHKTVLLAQRRAG
jgi:hypothetical protein